MKNNCLVCGSAVNPRALWDERRNLGYAYCAGCDLYFRNPMDSDLAIADRYRSEPETNVIGYNRKAGYRKAISRKRLHQALRHIQNPKRLLEVGCATGFFLREARDAGLEVSGLELSESYARHCRETGLDVRSEILEKNTFAKPFDVIAYFDVFEHVADPLREVAVIRHYLAPGGLWVLVLPVLNLEFRMHKEKWGHFNPDHNLLFSRRGMEQFLRKNGFEVLRPTGPLDALTSFFTRGTFFVARKTA